MNINDILAAVIDAVKAITGTFGPDEIGETVAAFRSDPNGASDDLFFAASGVHLYVFFANSVAAFNNEKDNLWTEITDRTKQGLTAPGNYTIERSLGEIALYISVKMPPDGGDSPAAAAVVAPPPVTAHPKAHTPAKKEAGK